MKLFKKLLPILLIMLTYFLTLTFFGIYFACICIIFFRSDPYVSAIFKPGIESIEPLFRLQSYLAWVAIVKAFCAGFSICLLWRLKDSFSFVSVIAGGILISIIEIIFCLMEGKCSEIDFLAISFILPSSLFSYLALGKFAILTKTNRLGNKYKIIPIIGMVLGLLGPMFCFYNLSEFSSIEMKLLCVFSSYFYYFMIITSCFSLINSRLTLFLSSFFIMLITLIPMINIFSASSFLTVVVSFVSYYLINKNRCQLKDQIDNKHVLN